MSIGSLILGIFIGILIMLPLVSGLQRQIARLERLMWPEGFNKIEKK